MTRKRRNDLLELPSGEVVRGAVALPPHAWAASEVIRRLGEGLLYAAWRLTRTLLFLALRMFRPLLRFAMALLSGLSLLMAVTLLIVSGYRGWAQPFLWDAGVAFLVAFVCSAVTWYYDVLLVKLTPEGHQLVLWS